MSVTAPAIQSLDAALAAVVNVGPVARECAQKSEDGRTLTPEVVDAIAAEGLWGAFAPREVGGGGLAGLSDQYEVVRAMSDEDGSAGWALFIGAGTAMIVGSRLPADGRAEVFADGVAPMAGTFMPAGQGRRVDGGYLVDGRWPFGSGIAHSSWVMATVIASDADGTPIPASDFPFEIRTVVVPRDDVTIIDDWHVAGLKGTGSMSFTIESTVVPEHRTFPLLGRAAIDERKCRLPLFTLVGPGFAAVAVGLAQRMLDEMIAELPRRVRPPTFQPASENPVSQSVLGRAIATVRAVNESSRAIFDRHDAQVATGDTDPADLPQGARAEVHTHVVWAVQTCAEVVNELFRLGGGSAIYEPGILQRCWRDVNVLAQHIYVGSNFYEFAAKLPMNLPVTMPNL